MCFKVPPGGYKFTAVSFSTKTTRLVNIYRNFLNVILFNKYFKDFANEEMNLFIFPELLF